MTEITLDLKDVSVREFLGNYPAIKNKEKTTVFIPKSPNYPDVDLLIWDAGTRTLYPIQITVTKSLKAHTNEFFNMRSSMSFIQGLLLLCSLNLQRKNWQSIKWLGRATWERYHHQVHLDRTKH